MIGWGNNTLRGGQTTFHGIRMWAQMFKESRCSSPPPWSSPCRSGTSGATPQATSGTPRSMYTLVEGKLTIGFKGTSLQEIKDPYGVPHVFSLDYISNWYLGWASREHLRDEIFAGAWLGAKLGVGLIAGFLIGFWILGSRLGRRRHIRGAELVTARQLRRLVQPLHTRFLQYVSPVANLAPYRVAGVPYPERTETQHTIVSGTTGAGQNRADRRSGRPDTRPRRALRHLRQDGQLYAILLRSRTGCSSEPARCPQPPLVTLHGGPQPA